MSRYTKTVPHLQEASRSDVALALGLCPSESPMQRLSKRVRLHNGPMPEMREREIHQREQQSKTMTDLETRMRAAGAPQPATNLEGGWRSADDFPETSETVVGAMKDGTWGLVWFEHELGCWDSTEDILCADVAMWKALGPHPLGPNYEPPTSKTTP